MADRDREDMEEMVEDMAAGMAVDMEKDYSIHMDNMTYSIISY
jgi:hypothetical protein